MTLQIPVLAAALLLATAAAAQPAEPPGRHHRLFISPMGEPFRQADGLGAWFATADADHDGAVTPAEFRADALRVFKTLDRNGDDVLDGFEMSAYERDVAPEIASLGFDERPAMGEGSAARGGGGRRGHGGGAMGEGAGFKPGKRSGAEMRQGAGRFGLLNTPQPVASSDEDVNGKVTLAEWTHTAARRFAMLDKAGTGQLTLDALRPPEPDVKPRR